MSPAISPAGGGGTAAGSSRPALPQVRSVSDILVNGKKLTADITAETTSASITLSMDQASVLTVNVIDDHRKVIRSGICSQASVATVGGVAFVLAQVTKTGDQLTLTFEDQAIHKLRKKFGQLTTAKGTMTRVQFAKKLCDEAGVGFHGWPAAPTTKEPLTRGTSGQTKEDSWTCLTRVASEVQWRCFAVAGTVWFGPDKPWLIGQPSLGTLTERVGGIDNIDFDFDVGQPRNTATVYGYADLWAAPPGQPVNLTALGPATGAWLVTEITRDLHWTPVTITLTAPQKPLPEPAG